MIAFLPSLQAQDIQAKYVDRSDELPGMMSDEAVIGLAIGAGVLLTGLVVLLVVKKNQNKKLQSHTLQQNNLNDVGLSTFKTPVSFYNSLYKASEESPLQFFTDIGQLPNQNRGSNLALSAGVRIRF